MLTVVVVRRLWARQELGKNSFESKPEFGCVIESNAGSDGIN
jgi:hypothetical protein